MAGRPLRAGLMMLLVGALALPAVVGAEDESPIADAARDGDAETVRALLRQGDDVNAAQGDGMTALHWAAMHGDAALTEMLIYAGANLRAATRIGAYTPLFVASRYGRAEAIVALLAGGADVNALASTGVTALMLSAASGSVDAVRALLEDGADPNTPDAVQGQTALMFAASRNALDVIDLLVESGADVAMMSTVVDVVARETVARAAFRKKRQVAAAIAAIETPALDESAASAATEELKGDDGKDKPDTVGGASEPTALEAELVEAPADAASNELQSKETAREATESKAAEVLAEAAGSGTGPDAESPEQPTEELDSGESDEAGEDGEAEEEKEPEEKRLSYGQLVGAQGGMTALLHAARQGHTESVQALIELGADINQVGGADSTSVLMIATINGHFDLAMYLLEQGADPTLSSVAGATPLYAALNVQWAPKTLYPQPRAHTQQQHSHIDLMRMLLQAGADPNVRLSKKIWYSGYNFDLSGVNEVGGTPFWRAAYGSDVPAMKLLVEYGADTSVPTTKPPGRPRTGDATRDVEDVSGLDPVPVGGPAVQPLHAAAGVGYGEGFAANSHRNAPGGWMPAVRYLIEVVGADINAVDHEGNTPLHLAAARGDNEMILYLVSRGADVTKVNREGNTTADMANGPVQRIQPFPETVELLVGLGAVNNDKCVSC